MARHRLQGDSPENMTYYISYNDKRSKVPRAHVPQRRRRRWCVYICGWMPCAGL